LNEVVPPAVKVAHEVSFFGAEGLPGVGEGAHIDALGIPVGLTKSQAIQVGKEADLFTGQQAKGCRISGVEEEFSFGRIGVSVLGELESRDLQKKADGFWRAEGFFQEVTL
jgi:hypothetical protein